MTNIINFKKRRLQKGLILSGAGNATYKDEKVAKELKNEDLMFYGLYWDKVTITQIPLIQFTSPLIDQFMSNGVVEFFQNAPRKFNASEMKKLALESLLACQTIKKQDKDSDWLIYNNVSDSFNELDSDQILEQHTIRVKIAECLPYPSTYVPIDTLLKFKEKYIDELDNLHYAKYKLFEKITSFDNADKRELAQQYEIFEFDKALTDYQSAFASKFPNYSLKPMIADIKNHKPKLWEVGATIGDMALTGGTLAGAFLVGKTIIDIVGSKQKIHEAKKDSPQFHFISSAIENGIILQKIKT